MHLKVLVDASIDGIRDSGVDVGANPNFWRDFDMCCMKGARTGKKRACCLTIRWYVDMVGEGASSTRMRHVSLAQTG